MVEGKDRDYTTVSLPVSLVEKVDKVLMKGGYKNRPDFVRDAVRRLVREFGERHT